MDNLDDLDDLEPFDEDAVYKYKDYQLKSPSPTQGPDRVDLFVEAEERDGQVRSQRTRGDEDSPLLLRQTASDYSINIERLVWLDGEQAPTGSGAVLNTDDGLNGEKQSTGENLTLVVLSLAFGAGTDSSDMKIRSVQTELRFQSDKKRDRDPEVVAWGPFRHRQTWNHATAHVNKEANAEVGAEIAQFGQGISAKKGLVEGKSWEQPNYDQGDSMTVDNAKGVLHGVQWKLRENQLFQRGVTPELRIGVLVKRSKPSEAYRVTLRLAVRTSTLGELTSKACSVLGLPKAKPEMWHRTPEPGKKEGCYWGDGAGFIEEIDPSNLRALASDPWERSRLNPSWMNEWDRFEATTAQQQQQQQQQQREYAEKKPEVVVPQSAIAVQTVASQVTATAGAEVRRSQHDKDTDADVVTEDHPKAPLQQQQQRPRDFPTTTVGSQAPPPITMSLPVEQVDTGHSESWPATFPARVPDQKDGNQDDSESTPAPSGPKGISALPTSSLFLPPPGIDHQGGYNRLVSLEARAAQAEARIATLEALLFQLQQRLA